MEPGERNNVVAVLGTSGGASFTASGVEEGLRRAWHNTGNFLFQYGAIKTIRNPTFFVQLNTCPKVIKEQADLLLIPAANLINPAWDLSEWADLIEKVDLPVCILGLGAQASRDLPSRLQLLRGTERFIRAVADRCELIGVRGEYTADILARHGVTNTIVSGCPSNFINRQLRGADIQTQLNAAVHLGQDRLNWAYLVGPLELNGPTAQAERALFQLALRHQCDAILQTHSELLKLSSGHLPLTVAESARLELVSHWLAEAQGNQSSAVDCRALTFATYITANGMFFSDARSWIDRAARYDLVVGMRIHGSLAAIQGGGLGICVTWDSRTFELCTTMSYPWVKLEDVINCTDIRQIALSTRFSPASFDQNRVCLWSAHKSVIERNGLALSDSYADAFTTV